MMHTQFHILAAIAGVADLTHAWQSTPDEQEAGPVACFGFDDATDSIAGLVGAARPPTQMRFA